MTRNQTHAIFLSAVVFAAALIAPQLAAAQAAQTAAPSYPKMAPIEQYLMDRDAEIALARSAAPEAVSKDATVFVLTRHGYETAAKGTNGWACWVGRSWGAMFDHPEFWNPKVRAAECINAPAVRSVLPYNFKRTDLVLAGKSKAEIIAGSQIRDRQKRIAAARARNRELHDVQELVSHRSGRPQFAAHDVLLIGRRRSLGRESRQFARDGRALLGHFSRRVSGTQILPSHHRLPDPSGKMVRRNAGGRHVKRVAQSRLAGRSADGIAVAERSDLCTSADHWRTSMRYMMLVTAPADPGPVPPALVEARDKWVADATAAGSFIGGAEFIRAKIHSRFACWKEL